MRCTPRQTLPAFSALTVLALQTALVYIPGCSATPNPSDAPDAAVQPTARDDFLGHLVGDWHITRRMQSRTVENTMSARWVLGGMFVQMHMIDVARPPKYEAIVLVGHDPQRDRYVAYWCDSFGPGYSAEGIGVRHGDTVEFTFQYENGPFVNTFAWHDADRTWTFRGENVSPSGEHVFFMEDTATASR